MDYQDDPEYQEIEVRIEALRDEIGDLSKQKSAVLDHNEKDRIKAEIRNLEDNIDYQLKLQTRIEKRWEREQEE